MSGGELDHHFRQVQKLRSYGMRDEEMINISVHAIRGEARRQGIDMSTLGAIDKHGINALWDNIWRMDSDTIAGKYYMGGPEWAAGQVIKRVMRGQEAADGE